MKKVVESWSRNLSRLSDFLSQLLTARVALECDSLTARNEHLCLLRMAVFTVCV